MQLFLFAAVVSILATFTVAQTVIKVDLYPLPAFDGKGSIPSTRNRISI